MYKRQALGNVGAQCIAAQLNTGTAQLNAPFLPASNYSGIINAINAPKTCTTQCQLSPLTAINTLAGTPAVLCKLATSVTGTGPGTLRGLYCSLFGGSSALCPVRAGCTGAAVLSPDNAQTAQTAADYYGPSYDPSAGWSI